MNDKLQIFNHEAFGQIRTVIGDDGEPRFCLRDVCRSLGLTSKGVGQRLSDEVISNYPIVDSLGRQQLATFVNEDGLYDVILESRKPDAKAFRKWVTSEVLPSIRKHGMYMTDNAIEKALENPDFLLITLQKLQSERDARIKAEEEAQRQAEIVHSQESIISSQIEKIDILEEKTEFTDKVLKSNSLVNISQIANDYGLSGAALNQILKENKIIYWQGGQWNLYANYKQYGQSVTDYNDDKGYVKMRLKWTHEGRMFIHRLLLRLGYHTNTDRSLECEREKSIQLTINFNS